jgi:hypothetical protein
MAARKGNTAVVIALIIMTALSLILAVTTYIFVQQRYDEKARADAAETDLQQVRNEVRTAQLDIERLRGVIGSEATTADKVEAEHNDFLQSRFSAFQEEPKSLRRLADWLDRGLQQHEEQVAATEAQRSRELAEKANELRQAEAARDQATQDLMTARQDQMKESRDFQDRRTQTEKLMNDAVEARRQADEKAKAFQTVTDEIKSIGPLLTNDAVLLGGRTTPSRDRRARFEAESTSWADRVLLIADELRARQQTGRMLNQTLARLGAADENVQAAVRDARKVDSRIDGFDGRIAGVNAADRSVIMSLTSTAGLRPGLRFDVFAPDDPRPELAARKGVVQVIAIDSGTRARARIANDLLTDPIMPGDGVASPLWTPGTTFEIAVAGRASFPEAGDASERALKSVVGRAGGRIVDEIGAATRLVVDFGPAAAGEGRAADDKRRTDTITRARESGIPVVGLDALLDRLGVDRTALEAAAVDAGGTPRASSGVDRLRESAVAY